MFPNLRDNIIKNPCWSQEQQQLIAYNGLKQVSSLICDPSKKMRNSQIMFYKNDATTSEMLKTRLKKWSNGQIIPSPDGEIQPLKVSEKVDWIPEELETRMSRIHTIRFNYEPNQAEHPCCNCRDECGANCPCRTEIMECFHQQKCQNLVVADGMFPLLVVCQQPMTRGDGSKFNMIGVQTLEPLKALQVIGIYAGEVRTMTHDDTTIIRSEYVIDITSFVDDVDEYDDFDLVFLDPIPQGNTSSMINVCGYGYEEANVEFIILRTCNKIFPVVRALKDIKANEFLVMQNKEGWLNKRVIDQSPQADINYENQTTFVSVSVGDQATVVSGFYADEKGIVENINEEFAVIEIHSELRLIPLICIKKL